MYAELTESEVQTRVAELAPLVRRLAAQVAAGLPASVELGDLVQTGMMGLLDAARRYKSTLGAKFETYAVQRIRGSMLDGLRQSDWAPRTARASRRRIERMISQLQQRNGRAPQETEVAEALGMDLTGYQRCLGECYRHDIVSYEDLGTEEGDTFLAHYSAGAQGDPLNMLEDRKLRDALVKAIEDLPEREKVVMSLYYEQELGFGEIGEVLGVSESRVCQLHRHSIVTLRARLDASYAV
jgi:RNA polymerase sigma factor for flagellar operon FliA